VREMRRRASCNCGAPVVPAFKKAADAIKANPTKSNRQIAEDLGVGKDTVRRARSSGGAHEPPDPDARPTIDKPPKGNPWDDQDDREEEDQTVEKRVIGAKGRSYPAMQELRPAVAYLSCRDSVMLAGL
jgi:hypothetical protein